MFLIYPQVSSTTLLMFACTKLEDSTAWLMADCACTVRCACALARTALTPPPRRGRADRIKCWTPAHLTQVGAASFFTLLFPFGIPVAILITLRRAGVPHLAGWKRDCAWLRAIVQRGMMQGMSAHFVASDGDTITTESITDEQLRLLHLLVVKGGGEDAPTERALQPYRGASGGTAPVAGDSSMAGDGSTWSRLRGLFAQAQEPPAPPAPRAVPRTSSLISRRSSLRVLGPPGLSRRSTKASFTALFWNSERELLLAQLLDWAKQDTRSVIGQPRHTQLRWRSQADWQALAADGAQLGAHDAAERAAFFKYRFLFAARSWPA